MSGDHTDREVSGMKRLLLVAVLLLGAAAVAGVAQPQRSVAADSTDTPQRTLTVSGTGTATSTPTRASLSFGVQTKAATAKGALAQNATAMRKVLDALDQAGAKNVQTQSVQLSPMYGESQDVLGYLASNTVSATVSYSAAGATIDAAVDAGANEISGPSPVAEDADALYRKALANAVANAREHAEALADAAGVKLGAVSAISESGGAIPIYQKAAASAADSTPVIPGAQETTANVTVTFALA
jgi:uncharacterized protein YggE